MRKSSPSRSSGLSGGRLQGCITALVTPFRQGRIDVAGFRHNIRFQLRRGVSGLLVAGSTGEAASLSESEFERLVATAVEEAAGRVPVLVGAGTSSTAKSVKAVRWVEKLGADAVLVVAPYYVKPTQDGLYFHFRAIAEAVRIPVVAYNIPGRTAVNIEPRTIERLANDCPGIVAVKEASGSLDQASEIALRCRRLALLSGDDSLTLPMLAVGGSGVISVVSNIVPQDVVRMVGLFQAGSIREAQECHVRLLPLVKALFVETNPIPVKGAMAMLGMAAGEPRLPLTALSDRAGPVVRARLAEYGLRPARSRA